MGEVIIRYWLHGDPATHYVMDKSSKRPHVFDSMEKVLAHMAEIWLMGDRVLEYKVRKIEIEDLAASNHYDPNIR
jgi:hypothetical protein